MTDYSREWIPNADPDDVLTGATISRAEWRPEFDVMEIVLANGVLVRIHGHAVEVYTPERPYQPYN